MSGIQKLYDRGATDYFHGRENILARFEDLLGKAEETIGGGTFLMQGPPGIGKTALLAECWKKAEDKEWEVRELVVSALWNPDRMAECLGLPKKEIITEKTTGGGGKVQFGETSLGGNVLRTTKKTRTMDTPRGGILKIKKPLLLIMDEAQHLGEDSKINGPYKDDVRVLLTEIHNGKLGKPVILVAGGLGMTFQSFAALGISRPLLGCRFDMEPLKKKEERAVVQDWLVKEGEAIGDTTSSPTRNLQSPT